MGINVLNSYMNFNSDYRINSIPKADETTNSPLPEKEVEKKSQEISIEPVVERKPNADVHELSVKFNANEDYSYIGRDRNVAILDMQKAISDMKQDSILQDYQYFVGSGKNMFSSEDGRIIAK